MLRIVSDGTPHIGFSILTEAGEDLTKLLAIAYGGRIDLDETPRARFEIPTFTLDFKLPHVEWVTKHPVTGEFEPLAAMEFRDGTRVELADGTRPVIKPGSKQPLDPANAGVAEIAHADHTLTENTLWEKNLDQA